MAKKGYVFSEYEIDELGFKFAGADEYVASKCIGSVEEEMETISVVKKCRGRVSKKRTRGTGSGTLKVSMHVPWDVYVNMYGMKLDSLIEGVYGYGSNSVHPTFSITEHVVNEDGEEKLKAYPVCTMDGGVARKVENGSEEVAEVELSISVMPDEYGQGMYEALKEDLSVGTTANDWMTKFTPAMVQTVAA